MGGIPSQCPECGEIKIRAVSVPPDDHSRGNQWATRAQCENCGEYSEWFD
jgi:ribosomal protein L32